MRTRLLPVEEWPRLVETENPQLYPSMLPRDVQLVVVEEEGKIVASMAVLRLTHLENVWIHPDYRTNPAVVRPLLSKSLEVAKDWQSPWVMANVGDDHVGDLVRRLGGVKIPVDTYLVPLGE